MQGLASIDRTREWYLKQIAIVHDKMKYLGRIGSSMVSSFRFDSIVLTSVHFFCWTELTQSRLNRTKCTATQSLFHTIGSSS